VNRRRLVALVALAAAGLTACGASAPPAHELAIEVIDSMEARGEINPNAAQCMRDAVDEYDEDDLAQIADNAAGGSTDALEQLDRFEADLALCRTVPG